MAGAEGSVKKARQACATEQGYILGKHHNSSLGKIPPPEDAMSDLPSGCVFLWSHGTFYTGFQHAEVTPTLQMGKQRFNSKAWTCTPAPD